MLTRTALYRNLIGRGYSQLLRSTAPLSPGSSTALSSGPSSTPRFGSSSPTLLTDKVQAMSSVKNRCSTRGLCSGGESDESATSFHVQDYDGSSTALSRGPSVTPRFGSSNLHFLADKIQARPSSNNGCLTRGLCSGGQSEGDQTATSFHVQDYDDFNERVINSDKPVIVDFHADWCGPCRLLGPRLESQVDGREGRVLLAKVDVDDNSEIAMDYNVSSIPHVLSINEGKVVDQFVGVQEDDIIERFLDQVDHE